jgi:hypothetical protein
MIVNNNSFNLLKCLSTTTKNPITGQALGRRIRKLTKQDTNCR